MPFVSKAQRRALWAKNPKVAREFEAATPKGAKLPNRVGARGGSHVIVSGTRKRKGKK